MTPNKTKKITIDVLVDVLVCNGCGKEHVTTPQGTYDRPIEKGPNAGAWRGNGYVPPSGWVHFNNWEEWLCTDCAPMAEEALRAVLGPGFTLRRCT